MVAVFSELVGGLRLYGDDFKGITMDPTQLGELRIQMSKPNLALIRAFQAGDFCRRLPVPVLLMVDGSGQDVTSDMSCGAGSTKFWTVFSDDRVLGFEAISGDLSTVLDEVEARFINGGVRFEDIRYESGRIRGVIHIWAEIKVFGKKWSVNERVSFSIPVQGCHTVYDIGVARLELCIRAPNQVCAQLCVGKWGIEKCWDHCLSIPLYEPGVVHPTGLIPGPCRCGCQKGSDGTSE